MNSYILSCLENCADDSVLPPFCFFKRIFLHSQANITTRTVYALLWSKHVQVLKVLVAQLAEHKAENLGVVGSSPIQNMLIPIKTSLKYVLNTRSMFFLKNLNNQKSVHIAITPKSLIHLNTHLRLSTSFYSFQLVDICAYENLNKTSPRANSSKSLLSSSVILYNYHSFLKNTRIFVVMKPSKLSSNFLGYVDSITEIFYSANWLEREVSELNGVTFFGKKDTRNLMLQYGDNSSPLQKFFPTIGLRECFYSPVRDTIEWSRFAK